MDQEKIKAATNAARGKSGGAGTRVSDAYPADDPVVMGGRSFTLRPFTFGDLVRIEADYGDTDAFFALVATNNKAAIGYFFWLMLKRSDPNLTLDETYELLPFNADALVDLLQRVQAATGLFDGEKKAEPETVDPLTTH